MKTFYIKTFGCQMNKSDSEKICGLLENIGMNKAEKIEDADMVVFNTCCVRKSAENKFYGNLSIVKSSNGSKTIVVSGCIAQREKEKLINDYKVDIVLGPQSIEDLPDLIYKGEPQVVCKEEANLSPAELPESRESKFFAWLPVITGCNNFCSYCAVPYVRGREKSLPIEKAVEQAKKAADSGAAEITLLGQNVNSYGHDLYKEPRFAQLLKEISEIKKLKRIRFATSHPKDLNDDVIEIIASKENICNQIHLPVQSGSTQILKKMGRGYTKEEYIDLAAKIRRLIPGVNISTDIMVGFPGETENDFNDTIEVVKECAFDSAFTFIYSPRPGTKSFPLKEIDRKITSKRYEKLTALVKSLSLASNNKLEGKINEVLVEGRSKKDKSIFSGRTKSNRLVHFKGGDINEGDFIKVKINKGYSWYLTGEIWQA